MESLESLRQFVTDGVADWLARLVREVPKIVPRRSPHSPEDNAAAGWMRRFVHEIVTANPVTNDALSSIQVFLIEFALNCVKWDFLAGDPRFRDLDWAHAHLVAP